MGGILTMLLVAGGCAPPPLSAGDGSGATGEVVVFAAASLTDAFQELGRDLQLAHPGLLVTFNFGASSQLRTQLEQGARADVFASADERQMAAAVDAGVLRGPARTLARNELTIIVPMANPGQVRSLRDLERPGLRLVTADPVVPIGAYTRELLARASAEPDYGSDFQERVERNVVSREANVRQVVAKIQLGEADAAVVYSSDLTPAVREQVAAVPVPAMLNVQTAYPIAEAMGANPAAGAAFVSYALSPAGQAVLRRWGFLAGVE